MIERMARSHDNILGFQVSGDVTRADYDVLVPPVQAGVTESGSVRLVLDMTDLRWEKIEAWGADLKFGKQYHNAIERMAIVGHHDWEKWMTKIAGLFYARQARYFTDLDEAWKWVEEVES